LEQFVRGPQCPDNFIVIMGLEGLAWSYFEALLDPAIIRVCAISRPLAPSIG
jgi:hypothetical protein